MMNLKILRQRIKDRLDRETTKDLLLFIGYEVGRNYKFKLRQERTPSASVDKFGYITDFGDGWRGDPVALLYEKHGISLPEATWYIADCLGIDYE